MKKKQGSSRKGITLTKLVRMFQRHFMPMYLSGVFVDVRLLDNKKTLSLVIGKRDVQINENGDVIGSGALLI